MLAFPLPNILVNSSLPSSTPLLTLPFKSSTPLLTLPFKSSNPVVTLPLKSLTPCVPSFVALSNRPCAFAVTSSTLSCPNLIAFCVPSF